MQHPKYRVTLGISDLVQRLETAEAELTALAPAPRVELDRESVLTMVSLSLQALRELMKVH